MTNFVGRPLDDGELDGLMFFGIPLLFMLVVILVPLAFYWFRCWRDGIGYTGTLFAVTVALAFVLVPLMIGFARLVYPLFN